jgi:hypothetical protein
MAVDVDIYGLRELRSALRDVEGGVDSLKEAHKEAAQIVAVSAAARAPRRTGRLAASLRGTGQQRKGVIRAGSAAVPYAGPIHFGWPRRNIRPQPFIYDALDDRQAAVVAAYERNISELIRKAGLG